MVPRTASWYPCGVVPSDNGTPERLTAPEVGELLAGRYELRRALAKGGMGTVFEAFDKELGFPVALKVLHPSFSLDGDLHRRFRRESSVLESLDHPSIVRVLDDGNDGVGRSYMAMELLSGATMRSRMGSPMPESSLHPIIQEVSSALAAAHKRGVFHGDIKPENIFLLHAPTEDCSLKVLDFGISKVFGLDRLTRTGEVIGTPAYMAPELITGEVEVDARIDIYALGILMYEALTGTTPFDERNPARLMLKVVGGELTPIRERNPDIPERLVSMIERATARKAADRFGSVTELADTLVRAKT